MNQTSALLHTALLDTAGVGIADGVFPVCAIDSFYVREVEDHYETDFAVCAEKSFNIDRTKIAEFICENIQNSEINVIRTEFENGIIRIYVK